MYFSTVDMYVKGKEKRLGNQSFLEEIWGNVQEHKSKQKVIYKLIRKNWLLAARKRKISVDRSC